MGTLQDIVKSHDIQSPTGFDQAIKQARGISDGQLHYVAGFDPGAQSKEFKEMIALAKAEIGRREAAEQRKLVWISAGAGLLGVGVGAVLQGMF
jgi:hypothetical protein